MPLLASICRPLSKLPRSGFAEIRPQWPYADTAGDGAAWTSAGSEEFLQHHLNLCLTTEAITILDAYS